MKTESLNPDATGIERAADLLRDGKTVAFPTETVYGLGADAYSDTAVAQIFKAKNRPAVNPLIVHIGDTAMLHDFALLPEAAKPLTELWPGPLTLVLPLKSGAKLSHLVTAGLDTVAVRVPENPVTQQLLASFGGPVAAPSANLSGKVSATTAGHVIDGLEGRIAAVLDGGACQVGLESTIIGFDGLQPVLLRAGGICADQIELLTGQKILQNISAKISAPGQMASHYAPIVPVRINADGPRANEAWLGFGEVPRSAPGLNLSRSGNLTEAAANLFDALRKMDAICARHGLKGFAVAKIPDAGIGLAINDRLSRAAAPRN